MKKFLLISFVAVLLYPSVVSAAWWNPLTWTMFGFFHKKEVVTQVQVANTRPMATSTEEIKNLQKKNLNLKTPIKVASEIKRIIQIAPVSETSSIVQSKPILQPQIQLQPNLNSDQNQSVIQKQNYDLVLNQLIAEKRQYISIFEANIRDDGGLANIVRERMQKYPNEYTMQQSGQELLSEISNATSISRRLIIIVNTMIDKYSSYLGLGISPKAEDFLQINQQYTDLNQQSKTRYSNIDYLMKNFVLTEKTVLLRLTDQARQQLQDLQNSNNVSNQVVIIAPPPCDPQIESALSELRTTLDDIQNRPVAMSIIEGKTQVAIQAWQKAHPSVFSNQTCINELNGILRSY